MAVSYVTVHKPLSPELVVQHLEGELTLGAYALDSHARQICFDVDEPKQWQRLLKMASELTKQSITAYRELSRRSGHLWLFTPLLDGSNARRFTLQLLAEHQIKNIEVFPKQAELTNGHGLLVRLPLGIRQKTNKHYPLIDEQDNLLVPSIWDQPTWEVLD